MSMTRNGRGFLWWVAVAFMCWLLYASVFNTDGEFDPTTEMDVIEFRIGYRLGNVAERTDQAIVEQNRGVQGAVNHREHRVHDKVEKQTGGGE